MRWLNSPGVVVADAQAMNAALSTALGSRPADTGLWAAWLALVRRRKWSIDGWPRIGTDSEE